MKIKVTFCHCKYENVIIINTYNIYFNQKIQIFDSYLMDTRFDNFFSQGPEGRFIARDKVEVSGRSSKSKH